MKKDKSIKEVSAMGDSIGYFRLNLPADFGSYQRGNGEGIFAVCEKEDKEFLDRGASGRQFIAWAANESVYYPGRIMCGTAILAEMRGANRPVAVWDDLQGTREAPDNKDKILDEVFRVDEEDE